MPKVELDVETSVSPEDVRAAPLHFSDRRPEVWPGSEPSLYQVYTRWRHLRRGAGGQQDAWHEDLGEERYDWSAGWG